MPHRRRAARFTSVDWERLGRAVKRERALLGMTQAELAESAGVSKDVIERLERIPHSGSAILMTNLYKIENALGWDAGEAERILINAEASPLSAPPVNTRRARILEKIREIPGLGSQEVEALITAFDRQMGRST